MGCSLKLIICQCELGRGCAGLARDQNLPSFQLHPAQPPRSGSSPAATPEGWGTRCRHLAGKKSTQQIKPTPPHGGDRSPHRTDAATEQDDAWARRLPWLSRKLGTCRGETAGLFVKPCISESSSQPSKSRPVSLEAGRQLQVPACPRGHACQLAVAQPGDSPLRARGNRQASPSPAAPAAPGRCPSLWLCPRGFGQPPALCDSELSSRARSWQRWGNTSCQPQKLGFFSMRCCRKGLVSEVSRPFSALNCKDRRVNTKIREKHSSPTARWVFELNRCCKTQHGLDGNTSAHRRRLHHRALRLPPSPLHPVPSVWDWLRPHRTRPSLCLALGPQCLGGDMDPGPWVGMRLMLCCHVQTPCAYEANQAKPSRAEKINPKSSLVS